MIVIRTVWTAVLICAVAVVARAEDDPDALPVLGAEGAAHRYARMQPYGRPLARPGPFGEEPLFVTLEEWRGQWKRADTDPLTFPDLDDLIGGFVRRSGRAAALFDLCGQ